VNDSPARLPLRTAAAVKLGNLSSSLSQKMGLGAMRVLTDAAGERFWTVVMEIETESIDKFEELVRKSGEDKEFQEVMKGYHDLVDHGRREIYRIEG